MLFGTEAFEFEILYAIQKTVGCSVMDYLMTAVSALGNAGFLWIVVDLVMLISKKYRRTGVLLAVGLILGLIFGNVILKNVIARPRPCWIEKNYELLIAVPKDFSFPSGHTMASFISAFVLMGESRKLGFAALAVAVVMAFSRMYLFVHFPTDIIGGIAVAFLIVAGMKIVLNRIMKKKKLS